MSEPRSVAVEFVVSRGTDAAAAALTKVPLRAPAYAVSLWGIDDEILEPGWLCIDYRVG